LSPALPVVSGQQTIKALEDLGFEQVSQRGSHVKLKGHARTAIVPLHSELARGTLRSILRQADLTTEEFVAAL
jgi:predicted RNA binding protein YcfA (HicA-like mRNA interferase family)